MSLQNTRHNFTIFSIMLVMVFSSIVFIYGASPKTSALSGNEFNPGRIIDDAVFYNSNAMTAQQIQLFLNSKMPSCDTNGTQMYNSTQTRAQWAASNGRPQPPYTCLKDFSQSTPTVINSGSDLCKVSISGGTKSAAQIIFDSAKACGINPQVLLVMLQKEQSLITDSWPWPSQYDKAMGYACPDSGPNNSANCDSNYFGFFNQVYNAAKAFRRYEANPNSYNYKARRNNYILYNPNTSCGGSNVFIQNQATASLYIYTPYQPNASALNNLYGSGDSCGAYGNRNFWRMFNDWFGSTQLLPGECDSKVPGVSCVFSLMKTDGSQFLTTSKSEVEFAASTYGWIYEGIAFYATKTEQPGLIPAYRLRLGGQHYYTADIADYTNKKTSGSWTDEGVAFYTYPTTTSTNVSHRAYRLFDTSLNSYYWTIDQNKKDYLVDIGYILQNNAFNTPSGKASLPIPATGRVNIYRLQSLNTYMYTTSINELEKVIDSGFVYEGILTTGNAANSGTAVYRLRKPNNGYFYTSDLNEKNTAVSSYGMADEGISFYADDASLQIYRLSNTFSNKHFYTSNINEALSIVNTKNWLYEGSLLNKVSESTPVYRFLNMYIGRHFYTINLNEAMLISNKGWKYETVAFAANKNIGQPLYRLRLNDKHFYTANPSERDSAVNIYGFTYEGVAYLVSQTQTPSPVHRLRSGNDEYLYTTSNLEKDSAISKYGYTYEGVGFYLP